MAERGASGRIAASRTLLLGSAALVHALLFMLLARQLAQTQAYGEPPIMQVSLTPSPRPAEQEPPPERPERPERAGRAGAAPPLLSGRAGAAPPLLSAPAPAGEAAPLPAGEGLPGPDTGAAVRQALGSLRGCDRTGLSREARERCEARRWAGGAADGPRLNLDPSGRYAENPEAFLSRRPDKGCRVRVTGDVGPVGDDQNARAGVTCVKPF